MLSNSPCHLEVRIGLQDLKQTLNVKPLPARPPAWFEIFICRSEVQAQAWLLRDDSIKAGVENGN